MPNAVAPQPLFVRRPASFRGRGHRAADHQPPSAACKFYARPFSSSNDSCSILSPTMNLSKFVFCGALSFSASLFPTVSRATTAIHLSDFGGIEEPTVLVYPKGDGVHPGPYFVPNDPFVNITDLGNGEFRFLLRFHPGVYPWWDGDRATHEVDRQRAEVKTLGPNQKTGETYVYSSRWRSSSGFAGSGGFCHITQLKPVDGVEGSSGAPLVVTSIEAGSSSAVVDYASTSFSPANVFSPKIVRSFQWSPATFQTLAIKVKTSPDGQSTGLVQVSINGDTYKGVTQTEVSRPQTTTYYPKWGLYRAVNERYFFGASDYIDHKQVSATKQ